MYWYMQAKSGQSRWCVFHHLGSCPKLHRTRPVLNDVQAPTLLMPILQNCTVTVNPYNLKEGTWFPTQELWQTSLRTRLKTCHWAQPQWPKRNVHEKAQREVHLKAWKPPQLAVPSLMDQPRRRGCTALFKRAAQHVCSQGRLVKQSIMDFF